MKTLSNLFFTSSILTVFVGIFIIYQTYQTLDSSAYNEYRNESVSENKYEILGSYIGSIFFTVWLLFGLHKACDQLDTYMTVRSKDITDKRATPAIQSGDMPVHLNSKGISAEELKEKILSAYSKNKKTNAPGSSDHEAKYEAMKVYSEITGKSLSEAKNYIDSVISSK
jgi:ribosomal protein L7/L12